MKRRRMIEFNRQIRRKKISSLELNEIEFNLKLNVDPFVGLDILLLFSSILCLLDSADNPLEA